MPYSGSFTTDGLGILQYGVGVLTVDELIAETIRVSRAGDELEHVRYAIVDFSGVTEFQGAATKLAQLADLDVGLARRLPNVALVVVASRPLLFGIARMWEALAHQTGWRIMVVQTREEALAWLRTEVPGVTIS